MFRLNSKQGDRIFTIPNILSMLRIALIPAIVWCYCLEYSVAAFVLVVASAVTDVADGFIARRFNQVSALGKALDPIADKLTQITVTAFLIKDFSQMWFLFAVLLAKELVVGAFGVVIIRVTGTTYSALWHGKLATVLVYCTMLAHILVDLSAAVSSVLVTVSVVALALSMTLYICHDLRLIRTARATQAADCAATEAKE